MRTDSVVVRYLGSQDYLATWEKMREFTSKRDENTFDEIWLLEHPPVFTQGQNGKPEHILNPRDIPVIQVDRGGQVTYHGPGQLVVYTLVDLKRKQFNVRQMVSALEKAIIDTLQDFDVIGATRCHAPGVYVNDKKIASIGLRIRKSCAFHGLALNVAMDLEPFSRINPCGFDQLKMTQLSDFIQHIEKSAVAEKLIGHLITNLGYTSAHRYY